MIERFFYVRTPGTHKGGATIRVVREVDTDEEVQVQVTHCSQKTRFNRREGRGAAMLKGPTTMPISELPKKFKRVARRVLALSGWKFLRILDAVDVGDAGDPARRYLDLYDKDWTHIVQYIGPKPKKDSPSVFPTTTEAERTSVQQETYHSMGEEQRNIREFIGL